MAGTTADADREVGGASSHGVVHHAPLLRGRAQGLRVRPRGGRVGAPRRRAQRDCGVQVIFTPQHVDIPVIAAEVPEILVFAQHIDALEPGRGVGSVLPEAVKAAGAAGVLLNHAERRLDRDLLARTMARAREVGLATMVCADDARDAAGIASLRPDVIIVEDPDLIGVGSSPDVARASVAATNGEICASTRGCASSMGRASATPATCTT